MDYARRIGNPEAVKVFPQLLHLVAPRNFVVFQVGVGRVGVVGLELDSDVGSTDIRHFVVPKPDRTQLEITAFGFLLVQGNCRGVAVK